jgi:hypothetical protein
MVSGDSFNRPGCGAVWYRERSFPYSQLKTPQGRRLLTRAALFHFSPVGLHKKLQFQTGFNRQPKQFLAHRTLFVPLA